MPCFVSIRPSPRLHKKERKKERKKDRQTDRQTEREGGGFDFVVIVAVVFVGKSASFIPQVSHRKFK